MITVSTNIHNNITSTNYRRNTSTPVSYSHLYFKNTQPTKDEFIKNKQTKNTAIRTGIIATSLLAVAGVGIAIYKKNLKAVNPYQKMLAQSLSEHLGEKIEPKKLSSVISGEELLKDLKSLKRENFVASAENIKNGTFLADLHSHSNFSDGKGTVETILDQVAKYSDHVNKKTGKKFLFALTDHDTMEGSKKALEIISENPDKFKNVKFVTGAEMSYVIKSDKTKNPFETVEILVYGANPFDKKVANKFSQINQTRKNLAKEYIEDLKGRFGYADFSMEEFTEIYKPKYIANEQWKVHHYGQTKNAIAGLANSQSKDKSELYREIMSKTDEHHMALGHLRDKGFVLKSYGDDSNITKLCNEKYSPHQTESGMDYAGENSFESLVDTFGQGKDTFFALAHPYYMTERNSASEKLIQNLTKQAKGYLKASESYHQAYNPTVNMNNVEQFNKSIVSTNKFIELGGRDNHEINWLSDSIFA